MALFHQTIRKNAKGEPIFFRLIAVVLLTIFTCFGIFFGVIEGLAQQMYQLAEAPENLSHLKQKTRNLKEQKPTKVLREYKEVLGEKISKELGTQAIGVSSKESGYVITRKIDIAQIEESTGLNSLAKSDCERILRIADRTYIDIRYVDKQRLETRDFDCSQVSM